jgi:hypothetical protein
LSFAYTAESVEPKAQFLGSRWPTDEFRKTVGKIADSRCRISNKYSEKLPVAKLLQDPIQVFQLMRFRTHNDAGHRPVHRVRFSCFAWRRQYSDLVSQRGEHKRNLFALAAGRSAIQAQVATLFTVTGHLNFFFGTDSW